jgi:acetylornithine deacetylase
MENPEPISSARIDLLPLQQEAIGLLKELIATPSFSREEEKAAAVFKAFLKNHDVKAEQYLCNIWAKNKYFDPQKPSILLNSHLDTVRPNPGYTSDPFTPLEKDGKIFGLGSNDAGGSLVALAAAFLYFYEKSSLKYNLILAATAEEEISGSHGVEALLPHLGKIDFAIVGEPTDMRMAITEKGLMVLDCTSSGRAGHTARNEGDNAIYNAIQDIEWFRNYQFPKVSELLGSNKMTVTVIETDNKAHNVVPARCRFVVDVRINELYSLEDVLDIINTHVLCEVKPRSMRLRPTVISPQHPLVQAGRKLGLTYYGSPTTSDKALMPFPALKMGPGHPGRSHTADEFIFTDEIKNGIELCIQLLNQLL